MAGYASRPAPKTREKKFGQGAYGFTESDSAYSPGKHSTGGPSTAPIDWLSTMVKKVGRKIKPFIDKHYK